MSRIFGNSRAVLLVCAALLAAVTVWLWLVFPRSVVDDAYIIARYAKNLAIAGQPTWNVGENPVEGYTGILLLLLYALCEKFGPGFEVAAPLIGLACFAGTGLALLAACRKFAFPLPIITAAMYALTPFLYRHVFSGMETLLLAFLLTLAVALFLQGNRKQDPSFLIVLLFLSLTRPEGALFAFSLAAAFLAARQAEKRALVMALCLFALPFSGYFVWRWSYYGHFLPNTFYAKYAGGWTPGSLEAMTAFFLKNSITYPLLFLLALGACLFLAQKTLKVRLLKENGRGALFSALAAVLLPLMLILVQYARSNLTMNFSHRFLAPFYPLLLLLAGTLLNPLFQSFASRQKARGAVAVIALLACLTPLALAFPSACGSEIRTAQESLELLQSEHIALGQKLRRVIPPGERLATYIDSGAVPYYSELPTLDLGMLNDEYLAHNRPAGAAYLDYVFQQRPAVFAITSYSPARVNRFLGGGNQAVIEQILRDPRFSKYMLVETFAPPYPAMKYFLLVFVRDDLISLYRSK